MAQSDTPLSYLIWEHEHVAFRVDSHPDFYAPDTTYHLKKYRSSNWVDCPSRAISIVRVTGGSPVTTYVQTSDTLTTMHYYRGGNVKQVTKERIGEYEWLYDARWCEDGSKMWEWRPSYKGLQHLIESTCNGHVVAEIMMNRGTRCGPYKSYFPNGQLESIGNYLDCSVIDSTILESERAEGLWLQYYDTGVLKSETTFDAGVLHGEMRLYHSNGMLFMHALYEKGRLQRISEYLDRGGDALKIGTFKDGSGTVIVYNDNGNQIRINHYKNGLEVNE